MKSIKIITALTIILVTSICFASCQKEETPLKSIESLLGTATPRVYLLENATGTESGKKELSSVILHDGGYAEITISQNDNRLNGNLIGYPNFNYIIESDKVSVYAVVVPGWEGDYILENGETAAIFEFV